MSRPHGSVDPRSGAPGPVDYPGPALATSRIAVAHTARSDRQPTRSREVPVTFAPPSADRAVKNVVVLASGSGTLLQALLDDPDPKPYRMAAVGSDRSSCPALDRADGRRVPTFTCRIADHPTGRPGTAAWPC